MLEAAAPVTRPVFSGITSATVERIEIKVPESPQVTLSKVDDVWYTNVEKKHKADSSLLGSLFATLEKEVTGEVVSDTPDNYSDYQVNETSATHVRILGRDNKVLLDLYVGKAGSNFFSTFVRKAGEKEVLSANASLTYVFNKPEGWREKRLFDFDQEAIVEVSGELTSGSLIVRKEAGLWKLYEPIKADVNVSKLNPFLSSIANLRATAFVDLDSSHTLADYGLDPPQSKLTVKYEDKHSSPPSVKTVTLLLSAPKEENSVTNYYAKRADAPDVVKLTKYQGDMLTSDPHGYAQPESTPSPTASAQTDETTATQQDAELTRISETQETTSSVVEKTEAAKDEKESAQESPLAKESLTTSPEPNAKETTSPGA